MPYEVSQPRKLRHVLKKIDEHIYHTVANLKVTAWVTPEPTPFSEKMAGTKIELVPGDKWGNLWDCAWFHFEGTVPETALDKKVVLLIDVNGELCLVDEEGNPRQGLTNVNSEFDLSLGLPGKRVVHISERATGQEVIDLWGDAGCNDLFGRYRSGTLKEARIAICHEETRQLYYDFEVLLELAEKLPESSSRRHRLLQALDDASKMLVVMTQENVQRARGVLAPELGRRGGDASLTVSAIGHAHIDLAWLWPIRETIRKGARTFSTALRMMERYPDYVFGASQPQLYQWMKDHYPKLYEQMKDRVLEGRWEPQGAMWVEPDSNVAGGEALVRQILYGKRFFQQEFGHDMRVLWVPDIFGYTASLPQILKKSGVDYMMTQKLSWNAYNQHPHHSFFWEGIDGSKVLTHMPPEDTYNSPAAPRSIIKAEQNYMDKNVSDHCLMLFGIGDGGGGPGEEHLERLCREKNLLGLVPVVQEPSIRFFEKLQSESGRFKTWRGELYLEKHQGTLTSQARNKRFNRKMEKSLRELEFAAVLHNRLVGGRYPRQELETIWKEVLLYQFHDILPGSSITRVYDESLRRYEEMLQRVEDMIHRLYSDIARNIDTTGFAEPYVVFNSLPWDRTEWVRFNNTWVAVTVPSMGYRVVDATKLASASVANVSADPGMDWGVAADTDLLENEYLRIRFNADGTIGSLYDKQLKREVVVPGATLNQLRVYHDDGDAWDFAHDYADTESSQMALRNVDVHTDGPVVEIEHVYQYGESQLRQRVALRAGSRRIDFHNEVDWKESSKMLRAGFPVSVYAEQVNCEIQFGYIKRNAHRNTSWDFARDEICAHQWIDLSQPDYGVSLLNDCKYGHRASGNVLDVNLLRSPSYPDPQADRARHEFTYSLLPHVGDFVQADVYKAGYELNVPQRIIAADSLDSHGTLPETFSFVTVSSNHVMIEAVKLAEDDDSVIVRLYETAGTNTKATLSIALPFANAKVTDLMETPLDEPIVQTASGLELSFSPFEIKTLKVE